MLMYYNHRNLAECGQLGERGRSRAQLRHRHVADGLEQTALMIDQQHHRIIGINDRLLSFEIGDGVRGAHVFLLAIGGIQKWPEQRRPRSGRWLGRSRASGCSGGVHPHDAFVGRKEVLE
jgi:hypothetical protein